ncbi:MAG: DNA helicase RecQ [Thermodesulfobacteriota bacterium]
MRLKAQKILQRVFGYDSFRHSQEEVINELLSGRDALVLMPTGGGKSLCYQIPSIVRNGTGIVVSPLISLMQDQVSALAQSGVRAAYLNSTQEHHEARDVEEQLMAGELDLLYVAPERLLTKGFLALLHKVEIALFAIDEAHCVSQWGHDFRRDYLGLSVLHESFPKIPRLALTATADEATRGEIIRSLALEKARVIITGFDRSNIRYQITLKENPRQQLLRFIEENHPGEAGIVYCLSRKKVEATSEWLREQKIRALPYHAGLSAELRSRHQSCFLKEEGIVIVATIAFGLGIDKPDVRFVAHLDLPKSIEAYYQETGRAGRDGLAASAWMCYGMQDIVMLRNMIESSEANETRKRVERNKLDALVGLAEITTCRREALLAYLGEKAPKTCGNCDTCLWPVETWDGTIAAQKVLSCVYRTGEIFGAGYLIDILLGNETERMQRFGHHRLKTFGIGTELGVKAWRSVIRQLVARNFLSAPAQGFGSIKLTHEARAVLRGELSIKFRKEKKAEKKSRRAGPLKGREEYEKTLSAVDRELWRALRERRTELAREQGVPPYVIFHDITFMEIVERRPQNMEEMSLISGVGEKKLELYGEAFLNIISKVKPGPLKAEGKSE